MTARKAATKARKRTAPSAKKAAPVNGSKNPRPTLGAALGASIDGMAVVDGAGRIVVCNQPYAAMHGYEDSAALEGRGYRDLYPAHELRRFDALILPDFQKRHHWHGESTGLRRDGATFPQELSLNRIEQGAEAEGFVIAARDITERKRAQAEHSQLLAMEKTARAEAEAASRAKDEFLAVVSHELRTPMTAVLGWTWLLRSGDVAAEERDKALEVIDRNMKMQAQIIEDLLDVSSIITGKLHLNAKPFELSPVVQAAVDSVRSAASRARVNIISELGPALSVNGDAQRLRQVFWNLLNNAIKFNKEGGTVRVTVSADGGCAAITVEDSGHGIEPSVLPEIFDPFRQGEDSLTRQHRGLGLGLAIVRHLIEMHGGSVAASSGGTGQGAAFTVLIPLLPAGSSQAEQPKEVDRAEARREIDGALPGVTVLVVDDEPDTVNVLVELLKHCGAIVSTAFSAAEAFEHMRKTMPQLLVSDLAMPVEDGFSLIKKVRALNGGRDVRSLALSAHAGDEDRIAALEAGFDDFLSKPVDLRHLVQVLRNLLIPR